MRARSQVKWRSPHQRSFANPCTTQRAEVAIRKLEEQLERVKRLRDEATASEPRLTDLEWCRTQDLDLLAAWDAADGGQRSRLLTSIFEAIEAELTTDGVLRIVGVPREDWNPFFEYAVLERETGLEPATTCLGSRDSTN